MKLILIGILTLTSVPTFAQSLNKSDYANLLLANKSTLENVYPGMSKSVTTTASIPLEKNKKCDYTQTSVQTILTVEENRMIVHSNESYKPANSKECKEIEFEAFEEAVIFYEVKPSVDLDIEDLNASNLKSISRRNNIITMSVNGEVTDENNNVKSEVVTLTYDLTKSAFRYLTLSQSPSFKTETKDLNDMDVNTIDLRNILFCENNDGDNSECVEGDYSDILF